jgi:predicted TIM-barrel fold metal-dependent hydrolase
MKIDAHHHFWKYSALEYGWIEDAMKVIRRDFLPADLKKEVDAAGFDGVITVQARQTLEETRWLLSMAAQNDFIKAVVGWVPLTDSFVYRDLESLAQNPRLCAVRHVVQSEPDGFLLREDFNSGVSVLRELDLAYDLLILERQLPEAIAFVDQHPSKYSCLIISPNHESKSKCSIHGVRIYRNWLDESTCIARFQALSRRLILLAGTKGNFAPILKLPSNRLGQAV